MTDMAEAQEKAQSELVEWAKDGGFDVARFEALANAQQAPWQKALSLASHAPLIADSPPIAPNPMPKDMGYAKTLLHDEVAALEPRPSNPVIPSNRSHAPTATISKAAVSSPAVHDDLAIELPGAHRSGTSKLPLMAGATALVLLAVGGYALLASKPHSTNESAIATPPPPDTSAQPETALRQIKTAPKNTQGNTPSPAPQAADAPKLVDLQIQALPPEASLSMNGMEVSNPFKSEVELGSSLIFEAKSKGYVTRSLTINVDRARTVTLTLQEEPKVQKKTPARRNTRVRHRKAPARPKTSIITDNPY